MPPNQRHAAIDQFETSRPWSTCWPANSICGCLRETFLPIPNSEEPNFEQAGDFGGGLARGRYGFDDLFLLLGSDFRLSSGDASLSARFVQAGACALADHLA